MWMVIGTSDIWRTMFYEAILRPMKSLIRMKMKIQVIDVVLAFLALLFLATGTFGILAGVREYHESTRLPAATTSHPGVPT